MGIIKIENFTNKINVVAALAKAMGNSAQIAIIAYLKKVKACFCGDIENELPLSQPKVSKHLKVLKTAGLNKGSIEGNTICYCIDERAIARLQYYFAGDSVN